MGFPHATLRGSFGASGKRYAKGLPYKTLGGNVTRVTVELRPNSATNMCSVVDTA
jgi:hypothetical protein